MQKITPLNQRISVNSSDGVKEITITIAYDEKRAGERAVELFSLIGEEQAGQLKIAVQPWRLDLLADPDWSRFATAEALQADILVMAMCNPANLSAAVERWFTMWLDGKRGFHAAVIALVETESETDSSHLPALQFLENATKEAGLDFFTPRADHPCQSWAARPAPPQAFSYCRPYRHGGINE